jgi:hypothetical protein
MKILVCGASDEFTLSICLVFLFVLLVFSSRDSLHTHTLICSFLQFY